MNPALRYRCPAERWTDALPLGNGRLGAMCFGGTELDRFQLNDATCWSGSPATASVAGDDGPRILQAARDALAAGDVRGAEDWLARLQGGHSQAYQPLADLWIEQRPEDSTPDGYRRRLDLRTAVASHAYRTGTAWVGQEAWISAPGQALVIRRRTQQILQTPILIRLDSPHPTAIASRVPGGLDLVVRMPSDVPSSRADPVRYDPVPGAAVTAVVGLRVLADALMTVADDQVRLDGVDEAFIVVCVATDYTDPFTAPHGDVAALRRTVDDRLGVLTRALVADGGYAALRAAHERDHARLFDRVGLRLDADPAALQFQYGRYLLIASSRPGGPPANLQGLWNEHVRPPWSSNYTTNINLEMNYWPAEVANLAECHRPLLDWLTHAARRGTGLARTMYGASGWTMHHNSDAWCFCRPADGDAAWSFWPLAGAWLSRQAWEHYDYTGDDRFLYLVREAAAFCLDWLVEMPGGTLGTSPSTSPENHFVAPDSKPAAVSVSTTADLVLIRDLLTNVIRLAAVLRGREEPDDAVTKRAGEADDAVTRRAREADDAVTKRAREALARLPAERIGPDGRLAEWSSDLAGAEPDHRHTSHLIGVYPGDSIDPDTTPDLAAAARRALDTRGPESTGWSLAWRVALRARLRDADGAYEAVRRFLRPAVDERTGEERSGVYRNLFCAHPPFQIDGNLGFTAGVAEMLLQSHATTAETTRVHLLPALPAAWAEGAFTGLRARGGVTVDASWSLGEVRNIRLLSDTDRAVTIRAGTRRIEVRTSAHVPFDLDLGGAESSDEGADRARRVGRP